MPKKDNSEGNQVQSGKSNQKMIDSELQLFFRSQNRFQHLKLKQYDVRQYFNIYFSIMQALSQTNSLSINLYSEKQIPSFHFFYLIIENLHLNNKNQEHKIVFLMRTISLIPKYATSFYINFFLKPFFSIMNLRFQKPIFHYLPKKSCKADFPTLQNPVNSDSTFKKVHVTKEEQAVKKNNKQIVKPKQQTPAKKIVPVVFQAEKQNCPQKPVICREERYLFFDRVEKIKLTLNINYVDRDQPYQDTNSKSTDSDDFRLPKAPYQNPLAKENKLINQLQKETKQRTQRFSISTKINLGALVQ